jgi:hypothetical protein
VKRPDGKVLRFFAGIPLASGSSTVGALCFADTQARGIDSDEYAILEAFGRRATAVLSNQDGRLAPMWAASGLLTREGLDVFVTAELSRIERAGASLSLLVFPGRAPDIELHERTAIGELGDGRFGVLVACNTADAARHALLDLLGAIVRATGLTAGGVIDVEDGAAAGFDARAIVHVADELLRGALRGASGTIERIVVRREPRLRLASEEQRPRM